MKETRLPRPARPGAAGSYDYEYERNGVSNLFMLFAPLEGWRRVEVTDRRIKADWARVVKQLVDEDYPHKDRIVLVLDNLNTHHPSSLYEEFEPAEARRIAERLEIHYTPKHGSWLDMAEIEIGVMARQCLDRRIPDQSALRREVAATAQPGRNTGGLALHHLGCAHQIEVPLPINTTQAWHFTDVTQFFVFKSFGHRIRLSKIPCLKFLADDAYYGIVVSGLLAPVPQALF